MIYFSTAAVLLFPLTVIPRQIMSNQRRLSALIPSSHIRIHICWNRRFVNSLRLIWRTETVPPPKAQRKPKHTPCILACVMVSVVLVLWWLALLLPSPRRGFLLSRVEYHWSVEGERSRLERRKLVLKAQERQLEDAFQVKRFDEKPEGLFVRGGALRPVYALRVSRTSRKEQPRF